MTVGLLLRANPRDRVRSTTCDALAGADGVTPARRRRVVPARGDAEHRERSRRRVALGAEEVDPRARWLLSSSRAARARAASQGRSPGTPPAASAISASPITSGSAPDALGSPVKLQPPSACCAARTVATAAGGATPHTSFFAKIVNSVSPKVPKLAVFAAQPESGQPASSNATRSTGDAVARRGRRQPGRDRVVPPSSTISLGRRDRGGHRSRRSRRARRAASGRNRRRSAVRPTAANAWLVLHDEPVCACSAIASTASGVSKPGRAERSRSRRRIAVGSRATRRPRRPSQWTRDRLPAPIPRTRRARVRARQLRRARVEKTTSEPPYGPWSTRAVCQPPRIAGDSLTGTPVARWTTAGSLAHGVRRGAAEPLTVAGQRRSRTELPLSLSTRQIRDVTSTAPTLPTVDLPVRAVRPRRRGMRACGWCGRSPRPP